MDDFRTTVDAYKAAIRETNAETDVVRVKKLAMKSHAKKMYFQMCFVMFICSFIPLVIFVTVPLFLLVTAAMIVRWNTFTEEVAVPLKVKSKSRVELAANKMESLSATLSATDGREAGRKFAKKLFG